MAEKPFLISGVVVDTNGGPVADAQIYFAEGPVPMPDIAMLTDNNGSFTLSAQATGNYQIACNAQGFAPAQITVTVGSAENIYIKILLKK